MYQGFRLNLDKNYREVVFGSLLTTFKVSNILYGYSVIQPKTEPSGQVKLIQILDTRRTPAIIKSKVWSHKTGDPFSPLYQVL